MLAMPLILDALVADDEPGGGEVGAFDAFHDGVQGGGFVCVGVVEAPVDGFRNFTQVVGWNVGGHADGDAVGAVHEQLRHA